MCLLRGLIPTVCFFNVPPRPPRSILLSQHFFNHNRLGGGGAISGRSCSLPIQPSTSYTPRSLVTTRLPLDVRPFRTIIAVITTVRLSRVRSSLGARVPGGAERAFQGVERKRGGRVACYRKSFLFPLRRMETGPLYWTLLKFRRHRRTVSG